jgi:hypothetical protein
MAKGFQRLALLIGARRGGRTSGCGLRDGGTRFFGCLFLLSGGGFFCLFFLFDFKLVLFPLLFGGLLLFRPFDAGFFGGGLFCLFFWIYFKLVLRLLPFGGLLLCHPVGAVFFFRLFASPLSFS